MFEEFLPSSSYPNESQGDFTPNGRKLPIGIAQEKSIFSMQNTRTIKIPCTFETNNKQQRGYAVGGKFTTLRSGLRFPVHVRTFADMCGFVCRNRYVCDQLTFFPFSFFLRSPPRGFGL